MRQAGRYLPEYRQLRAKAGSFMSLCLTPALACEATLQPIRRFGLDAAIIFSDILLIPHAWGYDLTYTEAPRLTPVGAEFAPPPAAWQDALTPVYQAVHTTRQTLRDEIPTAVPLIGFAGGAWTLACYMIDGHGQDGFSRTRSFIDEAPAKIDRLIDLLTPLISAHLIAQAKAGTDALQLFDSWAGMVPPAYRDRWLIQPTKAIAQAIHAATKAPLIGFPRGLGWDALAFAHATNLDALNLDSTVEVGRACAQATLPLQGNIDPVHLLIGGDALDRQIDHLCSVAQTHPLVLNLGHGIWPQTPPEHVAQFVARIRCV